MTDLLEDAESLLQKLPDAVQRRKLGERLSQAVLALRNAEHQAERMAALVELARITEFGATAEQRVVLDEMVETACEVGEQLEAAETEETLRAAVYEYEHTLPPAISALDRQLRERWRAVFADKFQPLVGLGQLLSSMNVRNDLGGRLAECGRKGQAALNLGSVADLLKSVRELLSELEMLQAERASEIGDDEVGEFINALAEKRATLAMVTVNVHEWLEAHHALDRLGINPR